MKRYILSLILVFFAISMRAQRPDIRYLNKNSGTVKEVVDLYGSGFSDNPDLLRVYFGGVKGKILSSTANLIKVETPVGSTYDPIKVINLNTKLSGATKDQFMPSFGGSPFDPGKLSNLEVYPGDKSGPGLADFCLCDVDQDGKNDYIAGNNLGQGVYVIRNQSVPGSISGMPKPVTLFTPISYVACGDVNNDGKMDIVAVRGGTLSDRIYVLVNHSTGPGNIAFSSTTSLQVSTATVLSKVKVIDMDNDGLADIVVTDNSARETGVNPAVHIFKNKTSNNQVSFHTPTPIVIEDDPAINGDELFSDGAYSLEVQDLDNDGFYDIAIAPAFGSTICVLKNKSAPGAFRFDKTFMPATAPINDLRAADIDGDGRQDIIAAKIESGSKHFTLLMNRTTDEKKIQFGAYANIPVSRRSYSVDVGDLNGDGKVDLAFSSVDENSSSFSILINSSVNGTPQFTEHIIPARIMQRPVKIADIDNDGRPDVTLGLSDNLLSVYRNANCIQAKTFPASDVGICEGVPLDIKTYQGINLTYTWKLNGADAVEINALNVPVYDSVEAGQYTVTISSDGGACESTSGPVNVALSAGLSPLTPSISAVNPVCKGDTLRLTAQDNGGAASFLWEGPGGWTSTVNNPQILSMQPVNTGYYTLQALGPDGCKSSKDTLLIDVIALPLVEITGPDAICSGTDALLSTSNFPDIHYQWRMQGEDLEGKNSASITVNQVGTYSVVVSKSGCLLESPAFNLQSVALPVAAFESVSEGCVGDTIRFVNASEIPLARDVIYTWVFGDGAVSTTENPSYIYQAEGNYTVSFEVGYKNTTCVSSIEKAITVRKATATEITASDITFCYGDSVLLSVGDEFSSYDWSNNKKGRSIYVHEGGSYTITVADQFGCKSTANIEIERRPKNTIHVTTSTGDTILIYGKTIQVVADNHFQEYEWTPSTGLTDPRIPDPVAAPRQTTTYSVSAVDENGCRVENKITIVVEGFGPKLHAAKIFSPNGDDKNQLWEIDEILTYPDNELIIFDASGKKVLEARPYLNDWDGTINGKALAEGVYYYVLKFRDSGATQSGSILVVR